MSLAYRRLIDAVDIGCRLAIKLQAYYDPIDSADDVYEEVSHSVACIFADERWCFYQARDSHGYIGLNDCGTVGSYSYYPFSSVFTNLSGVNAIAMMPMEYYVECDAVVIKPLGSIQWHASDRLAMSSDTLDVLKRLSRDGRRFQLVLLDESERRWVLSIHMLYLHSNGRLEFVVSTYEAVVEVLVEPRVADTWRVLWDEVIGCRLRGGNVKEKLLTSGFKPAYSGSRSQLIITRVDTDDNIVTVVAKDQSARCSEVWRNKIKKYTLSWF